MFLHGYGLNGAEASAFDALCKKSGSDPEFKKAIDFIVAEGVKEVSKYQRGVAEGRIEFEDRVAEEVRSRRRLRVPNLTIAYQNSLIDMVIADFKKKMPASK